MTNKYYRNLSLLTKHESYQRIDENKIFEEIEELESKSKYKEAANLLSVYVNFAMNKTNRILLNKSRECVSMLINADLVNFQVAGEDAVYISRKPCVGIQSHYNYTL